MSDQPAPNDPGVAVRAAIETLVFAPLGFGALLVEDAPAALRRARQELDNARFIGRLAVQQGTGRLRVASEPEPDRAAAATAGAEVLAADAAHALAIDGYDELPAIEIVALLDDLDGAQRAVIAEHERAHRQRRTVLGKIAQLDS